MRYRIDVRNSPNWRRFNAATLGVSVESPRWQGDKFVSIMNFAEANFDVIRIDITDALYRHVFEAQGMDAKSALDYANSLGALWLAQHADIINACSVKPQIVRWSEWYNHPDYSTVLETFKKAYEKNSVLNEAVQTDIMGYYRRQETRPTEKEFNASRDYLLEEIAVMCLQSRTLPCLEIYPGEELNCSRIVRACKIPEAPRGLELSQFAKIKFADRVEAVSQPVALPQLK